MAIQVGGTSVVDEDPSDNTLAQLRNINSVDTATANAIVAGIRNQNNVLRIFDSAGVEVRTLFAAPVVA